MEATEKIEISNINKIHAMYDFIYNEFRENNYSEIVIINIGSDRCIWDSFGPFFGTFMQDVELNNITIYGTLDETIQANNMNHLLNKIFNSHQNALFIGVDACTGEDSNIGKMFFRKYPLKPGSGVGKELPDVGKYSITCITREFYNGTNFSVSTRISFIRKLSFQLSQIIIDLDKYITMEKEMEILEDDYRRSII